MQAAGADRDGDLPERPFLAEVNLPAALHTPEPRANAREGNCSTPDSHEFGFSEQASWFGSPEPSILRRRSHFGATPGSISKTGGLHGVELSPAGRALLRGVTPKMKVHTVRRRQQRSDRLFVTGDPEDLRHILRDAHILNDARERAKRRADQSLRKVLCELRETMASGASAKPSSYRTTTATTTPSPVDLEQRQEARERILDLGDRFLHASVLEDDDQHHAKLVDIVEDLLHLRTFENKFCTLVLFAISPYSRRALAIEALNDEDQAQAHASPRNLCSTSCNFEPFTPSRVSLASPPSPISSPGSARKYLSPNLATERRSGMPLSETELSNGEPDAGIAEAFERDLLGFQDRLRTLQKQIEAKQGGSLVVEDACLRQVASPLSQSIPTTPARGEQSQTTSSPLPFTPSKASATPKMVMTTPSAHRHRHHVKGQRPHSTRKSKTSRASPGPRGICCRICEEVIPKAQAATHFESCLESYKNIYRECRLESLESSLQRARTRVRSSQEREHLSSEAYFAALDQIAEGVDLLLRARVDDAGVELEAADRRRLLAQAQERLASILDSLGKAPAYGSLKALAVEALDAAIAQSASAQTPRSRQQLSKIPKRPKKPSPKEFDFTKVISRGSVGRVFLAIKRGTGDVYAVKVMDKAEVVRKNLAARIVAERNVMARADCPFVVKLFFSFETRTRLFLAMEFVQGGDILALLNTYGVIPEGAMRWYASEIVVALKYLHERLNVCHRDLKPDNILIGRDGHVKLTDFGLSHIGIVQGLDASVADVSTPNQSDSSLSVTSSPARDFENKGVASAQTRHRLAASTPALLKTRVGAEASETRSPLVQPPSNVPPTPRDDAAASARRRLMRSQVGTPDYMAPEILLGTGHGFACDWWSLGIIIYEMLFGMPPFNDETPQRIFHNILSGKLPPEEERAPVTASEIAWGLIHGLLQTSAADRLGSQGAWELQQHPFFEGVSWVSLESGDLPSTDEAVPFVPAVVSEMDTKYFESASPAAPSIPASPQTHSFSQHSPGEKGQPAGLLVEDETLDMLNSDDEAEDVGPETAEFEGKPPPLYFDDDEDDENGLEGDVPHVDDDDDDANEDNGGDATCSKVREEDFHQHESRCKKVNESSEGGCRVNKMGGLGSNNQRETVKSHVKKLPERESIFPEIDFSCSQLSNLQKLNMAAVENDGDDASDIDVDDSENEDKEQDEDDEGSGNAEEFE